MARTSDLTCRQAQRLMQRLLDRHWTKPMPAKLQRHFQACTPCHTWQCLFQYEPTDTPDLLPTDFPQRVVSRLRREEWRRTWFYRASLFAAAAAVIFALFLGKVLVNGPNHAPA